MNQLIKPKILNSKPEPKWEFDNPLERFGLIGKNLAVLLIDMQQAHLNNIYPPEQVETIIINQQNILRECTRNNIPVAVIEYENRGKTIPELKKYIDKLNTIETFEKRFANSFSNGNLNETLNSWNVDDLFLMGVYASRCVKSTANGAIKNNFNIHTSKSVIGRLLFHKMNLDAPWYEENGKLHV